MSRKQKNAMNTSFGSLSFAVVCLAASFVPAQSGGQQFLPNRGQWPNGVHHYTRSGPMQLWFTDMGYVLRVGQSMTRPDTGPRLGRESVPEMRSV